MPFTPSENEEKFFKEQELQQRMQKLAEEEKRMAEAEKCRLKELHWLHCPKCGQTLGQEIYGTVEVDVCPSCKGLWLDANELESILTANADKGNPFRAFLKVLGA